jgi:perosamine synthetase
MNSLQVPFSRPHLKEQEIEEVVAALRSGWLTSGSRVRRFEQEFAAAVGAPHAVALNSCTAALHLAVESLGLKAGEAVLVPTMTFAATAEVVRYLGAIPILVDCDPITLNMDLDDAERKLSTDYAVYTEGSEVSDQKAESRSQKTEARKIVGIMPVHLGGMMMNVRAINDFAAKHNLWIVEDAAHAFPGAARVKTAEGRRRKAGSGKQEVGTEWRHCGQMEDGERRIVCFSFYANKSITTGEGGMAVTGSADLAARMRLMSLHGLSQDAWERYSAGSNWDYKIIAPGFKYNLTDIAAAIGIQQLKRAEEMRQTREAVARCYFEALASVDEIELPSENIDRIHAWHLFPIRLQLESLDIDRNQFIEELKHKGVGCSVHWRPLHLHPYYQQTFRYQPEEFPVATREWQRLVSLPIFSDMRRDEIDHVIKTLKTICRRYRRQMPAGRQKAEGSRQSVSKPSDRLSPTTIAG